MVEISPFRALRYNDNQLTVLAKVMAPPYDVIRSPEQESLLSRHPNNIVRVELPTASDSKDRYEQAAQILQDWQKAGILVREDQPAFYGYEQRFSVGKKTYTRRGFFAALRLETPGEGRIRPHERTFPKHKEDRLMLMRTTHANVSPIFGLFIDRQKRGQHFIAQRMRSKPLATAKDNQGVTHRLWKWNDAEALKVLAGVLRAEDVLIADGHHRYETAWNYQQERLDANGDSTAQPKAYQFVMTFLCPLTDPGLVIQPTHRLVRWQAPWTEWEKRISKSFILQPATNLSQMLKRLQMPKERAALGLVFEGGKLFWLKPRTKKILLPVVPLHEEILQDVPLENVSYIQDPQEVARCVREGTANAAFLLPPPDKNAFARICKAGKRLPQKSTYFYPKLATGVVMRSLDGAL